MPAKIRVRSTFKNPPWSLNIRCQRLAPRLDIDHHLINIQPSPNLVLINFSSRSTQLDFLLAIKVVVGFWSTPDRYPTSPTYWCDRYGRIPHDIHIRVCRGLLLSFSQSRAKIGYRSSLDRYPTAPKSCAHKLLEQVDATWFCWLSKWWLDIDQVMIDIQQVPHDDRPYGRIPHDIHSCLPWVTPIF